MVSRNSSSKKKEKRQVPVAVFHILSGFNNTIITVSDLEGKVLYWTSAGRHFKGVRKSTPYAAQVAADQAVNQAMSHGIRFAHIVIKGIGPGRDSAIRSFQSSGSSRSSGFEVKSITDATPVRHGGCRPRKARRV